MALTKTISLNWHALRIPKKRHWRLEIRTQIPKVMLLGLGQSISFSFFKLPMPFIIINYLSRKRFPTKNHWISFFYCHLGKETIITHFKLLEKETCRFLAKTFWEFFIKPTLSKMYVCGPIFIVANGQILENSAAIWSHRFILFLLSAPVLNLMKVLDILHLQYHHLPRPPIMLIGSFQSGK